jgi:hypothetical protein
MYPFVWNSRQELSQKYITKQTGSKKPLHDFKVKKIVVTLRKKILEEGVLSLGVKKTSFS